MTIGMVVVAFFAANAGGGEETTIRSTLRRTRSAASSGRRSFFCSANRYSMVIFFPLNPPKLAEFLPELVYHDRATRRSACDQETYAEDFALLLRVGG